MEMKIPFCKPSIGKEEIDAVTKVLKSGWLAAGKETEAFEREFADFIGVKYAIFTNSGTSALKMAYKWFQERGYNQFNAPLNTFCATRAAAVEIGLIENEAIINPNNVVNVKVHYGGVKELEPCDIEDSAHRIEPNDPLIGQIRCYSFYVTKNMTTGAGGMLVTNDKEIYERCRTYWKDGLTTSTAEREKGGVFYEVVVMAGGYDGSDVSSSIGRAQLKKLPEFNRRRNEIVARYNGAFGSDWRGNHLYPYEVGSEGKVKDFIAFQKEKGISCGYHYPNTGWTKVSLPLYPSLTNKEVDYIIKSVREYEKTQV